MEALLLQERVVHHFLESTGTDADALTDLAVRESGLKPGLKISRILRILTLPFGISLSMGLKRTR
ncbi:hypothetical protein CBJ10_24815 [Salmonella enterica]|nr:hypothetical protein [Salmonella enterica]